MTGLASSVRDAITSVGEADIMVGIPSFRNAATIGHVVRAAQAGLVQYFPDLRPLVVNADAGSPDGTQNVVVDTEPPDYVERILLVRPTHRLHRVSLTYPEVDGVGGKGAAIKTIFAIAAELDVKALVLVDSDLRSIVPEWIELLAGPILKGGYDYVTPHYVRHKHDGTITNTVTYPLTRALYGRRIRQPIGGDFGVSGDLVRHYLAMNDWTPDVSRFGIDIWMTTHALTGGYAVAEARLGSKVHDPKDPGADLGPMFRQVVGTLLRLSVANADHWRTIHGSRPVPDYGFERLGDPPPLEIDARRLLGTFHAASLVEADAESWRAMLRTETLAEVRRLAAAAGAAENGTEGDGDPTDSFRFPDETWAAVLYDLILAVRRGQPTAEHAAEALVPIYFGRVASHVLENRARSTDEAEASVERQARAFEAAKPAFVKRWQNETPAAGSIGSDGSGR